jgi:hypothetical protein
VGRSSNGWQRPFEDPIGLPDGRTLVTLRDAADYITALPEKEAELPEWQAAIEVLLLVSRGGPTMMARIGFMQALHRNVVREFKTSEKKTHWGKRKLKRNLWTGAAPSRVRREDTSDAPRKYQTAGLALGLQVAE